MQTTAERYLQQLNKSNAIRSGVLRTLPALSLVVTLCVFWCLKLTGITLAGEAFCGMAEHVHGPECPIQTLICGMEESQAHMHTEECIFRELICETEEIPAHSHSADCLVKTLVCTEAETEGHTHGDSCILRTLTCTTPEIAAHFHEDLCRSQTLICTTPEEAGHSHGEGCFTQSLICGQEESETHTHGDDCSTASLTCTLAETPGHSHGEGCYETALVCTLEETEGHAHGTQCYTEEPGFHCGLEEHPPHAHGESCYLTQEGNYQCGTEETQGHTHETLCYRFGTGFACGLPESEEHIHTEQCISEQTQFGCGLEISPGHAHQDTCYDTLEVCPLEEHIHDSTCYSDITADVETSDDWEMTLAGLTRSASTAENIVMVARAQLGYTESTRNFQVDENGIRRGYTRFGQWYGNPYGDWSAMFASFCLYYAGVEEVPANAGPEAMRLEWDQAGLYISAAEYAPKTGHLLFLDKDQSGTADAVAVITGFADNQIAVIEGDLDNTVAETAYSIEDPAILGYGMVPFAPELTILPLAGTTVIAQTTAYDQSLFTNTNSFVLYTASGANYYAFDGSGNAVPIYIDENGTISADVADPSTLLWTFASSGTTNSYLIRNNSTGRYMHAFTGTGANVTTSGAYASLLVPSGTGIKVQSNTEYARLDVTSGTFQVTQNVNLAATYQLGIFSQCSVWLDGTNGGLMSLGGSPNTHYSVLKGGTMVLPTQWQSPDKYSYRLQGWYDVINNVYYPPGAEITVNENMVFYADWVASTYNIGQYNSQVTNTVSTNDFITTRVFDYGILFNVLSSYADVEVSASGHTETWNLITSGTNPYNGDQTLDYIFRDWDRGSEDISYPANTNTHNTNGGVYSGLYSSRLRDVLFSTGNAFDPGTGTGIIGKHYLGTGDHLFQYASDPSDPNYGYYYYDSSRNAASYNQSAGRFYVYDYLECTRDSLANDKYFDFLPLNSPYANTNGKTVASYTYSGSDGEYGGTTHHSYDAKYNTNGNTADYVGTNFLFGMSIDIDFYLPTSPGTQDSDGTYGNRDLYGKEMHFKFSGDDDVWVLVDGQLVLDIGGIHGIESGDINFSSGVVTVNGTQTGSITSLAPGDHRLTILYLERGSSQSDCAIYFNMAPRFSFTIQKEDLLTQQVLNGAEFSVYTDSACTIPAELWVSKASHDRGDAPTNVFTVTNGVANMWGMGAGNTYYIRETKPPDDPEYTYARGIICVSIDKQGLATYNVELLEETDSDGNTTPVSGGFTVHGFRIDEQNQSAYIVATNAPSWVTETTTVSVRKAWADTLDHSGDLVTVYLTITDPDGTVRQIREIQLGSENNWRHTWENLPKYDRDGNPIVYGVQEVSIPGYMGTVEAVDPDEFDSSGSGSTGSSGSSGAVTASGFENGESYLLQTNYGYLAAADSKLQLVSTEAEALSSPNAQWVSTVNSDGTIVLTNKAGQTLYYSGYTFRASSSPESTKNLHFSGNRLSCTIDHGGWSETQYPVDGDSVVSNITYNSVLYTTNDSTKALSITPRKLVSAEPEEPETPEVSEGDPAYRITNTPLEEETSLTVNKVWDYGFAGWGTDHEQAQVTVGLLANGRNTGRTVTLNLRNNWSATFHGLPYTDSSGNVIAYSVEERWQTEDWIPYYGDILVADGDPPTYSTTITNVYRRGTGAQLPSTGSSARMMYMLCGVSIMLSSLVYGIGSRRKRERRME